VSRSTRDDRVREKLDFTFDKRVSDQYDAQRAHPPEVAHQVGTAIAEQAGPAGRVLELGVGTGRIALPLAAAGCTVVGVDISAEMLDKLSHESAVQEGRIELVHADICDLPLTAREFDAVTAVHVLHLVPEWAQALAGAAALIKPGGAVILGRDWVDPKSMAGSMQNAFRRAVIEQAGPQLKAPTGGKVIAETIVNLGFDPEHVGDDEIVAAEWDITISPAEFIAAVRRRANPESWILTDDIMEPVVAAITRFAAEKWPGLDEPRTVTRRFMLTVFRNHG
jgi:ubiquinone/menaquinone biosynthesis C-methylase UbiE